MELKKQAYINMVGLVSTLFAQWFITALLPKMGGLEEAGILSLAMTIGNFLVTISTYNSRVYMVADNFQNYKPGDYLYMRLILILLSSLGCVIFIINRGYSLYIGMTIFLYWIYRSNSVMIEVFAGVWQCNNRLHYAGLVHIADGAICLCSFVVSYIFTNNLYVSILIMMFWNFIIVSFIVIKMNRIITTLEELKMHSMYRIIELFKICFPVMFSSVVPVLFTTIHRTMVEEMLGFEQLGIYGTITVPTVLFSTLSTGIFVPLLVPIREMFSCGNIIGIKRMVIKIVVLLGTVCGGAVVADLCLGKEVFRFLWGEKVSEYYILFIIVIIAIFFSSVCNLLASIIVLSKNNYKFVVLMVIGSIFGLIITPPLINKNSLYGAGESYLISFAIQAIAIYIFMNKNLKMIASS